MMAWVTIRTELKELEQNGWQSNRGMEVRDLGMHNFAKVRRNAVDSYIEEMVPVHLGIHNEELGQVVQGTRID